MNKMFAVTNPT